MNKINYQKEHKGITTRKTDITDKQEISEEKKQIKPVYARHGQLLVNHLDNVAMMASEFGAKCGLSNLLFAAGKYHDYGKYSSEFQNYLFDESEKKEKVEHSIFGAQEAFNSTIEYPYIAEILGNIIAHHHGELSDNLSPDGSTPLIDNILRERSFSVQIPSEFEGDTNLLKEEFINLLSKTDRNHRAFFVSLLIKFAYSCLIDADRYDAYLHSMSESYKGKHDVNWKNMLNNLERRLAEFDSSTPMSEYCQFISQACKKAGSKDIGIYKLEVPTGGGKTLSSMRFALEHAITHKLDRIIYVIPYLSILSQTANAIREALQIDDKNLVEHHSGFLPDKPEYYKLQTDRWDAPIILTTQVQFLESIFSARGSDLRKMHNMARSVIIFDEVQSIPTKCIHLFNETINFLHSFCGSAVLLCSATQPLFDRVERPLILTGDKKSIAKRELPIQRYKINTDYLKGEGFTYEKLASFVMEKHNNSTLVIVNTKEAAKQLYELLKTKNFSVLHLSTNMCAAHRDDVIALLREKLDKKESVICISTQLIEAGVDISFECVIRDLAGLDSIYQAAGRCNRRGEFHETKDVYVVKIKNENLDKLPDIKLGATNTLRVIHEGIVDIDKYYRYYLTDIKNKMDYSLISGGSIYDLLSENNYGKSAYRNRKDKTEKTPPTLIHGIRSAADAFYVIDKGRTEIVVPYKNSLDLVDMLLVEQDDIKKREIFHKLTKFSISLYQYQVDSLNHSRAIEYISDVMVLSKEHYDKERGIDLQGKQEFLSV